mgnify:FL=1
MSLYKKKINKVDIFIFEETMRIRCERRQLVLPKANGKNKHNTKKYAKKKKTNVAQFVSFLSTTIHFC